MAALPEMKDAAKFRSLLFEPGQWTEAIDAIRDRHGLAEPFSQSTIGSTVVFLSEQTCIKLQPPLPGFVAAYEREVAALRCVFGRLPIATPEVLVAGTLGEWRYFVSTRLPGRPIDAIWDDLDTAGRGALASSLGVAIQALHRLSGDPVARITEPWQGFRTAQRARCVALETQKGLLPRRRSELQDYLARLDAIDEPSSVPALLHTEIGPSHVLVDQDRITGLIDFGDAMVGDPEYDLAPIGMFVTRGDPAAFRAFCVAYGLDADALADPERPRRLLRHALLHRYGTLAWYLQVLAPPPGSLDELAAHWFGVDLAC